MEQLIKIQEKDGRQLVSARELHNFLEVQTKFTDWCRRMFDYGFQEDRDYSRVVVKNGDNSKGGRSTLLDYALTLDTAKQISMIQRSDRGTQAREYFLDCEKRANAPTSHTPLNTDEVIFQGYQALLKQRASLLEEVTLKSEKIKELAPAASYANEVLRSEKAWTTNTIAAELGMSAQKLNKLLHQRGVQYRNDDHVWVLYSKYKQRGYTKSRTSTFKHNDGTLQTAITTTWTELGRNFIHSMFNKALAC